MNLAGGWFAFGDGVGPDWMVADSDCVLKGFQSSRCSQINTPTPGQPFSPDPVTGAMCTSGTAAQARSTTDGGAPDFEDLWGAGIGLYFDNPGGTPSTKQPVDLSSYIGVSFDFSGVDIPTGNKIRVIFPFLGQLAGANSLGDPPYFAANRTDDHSTISSTSTNIVQWASVLGPATRVDQTSPTLPPAFDASKVYGIGFQVFTSADAATPYGFCVNNLTLLSR